MPTTEPHAMPPAQVRHPLLKGGQWVAGLWFPADWFNEQARARRIVDAWCAGAQVVRFAQGDLLRFAAPRWLDCDTAAGWALRREGHALCSAALDAAERARLPAADVWLVHGGAVLALHCAQGEPVDPSHWLGAGPALLDTFDCREAMPEPVVLDAQGRTLREVLGAAVPPASAEQAGFVQAVTERALRAQALAKGAASNAAATDTRGKGGSGRPALLPKWLAWVAAVVLFSVLFNAWAPMAHADTEGLWTSLVALGLVVLLVWWLRRTGRLGAGGGAAQGAPRPAPGRAAAAPASPLKPRATGRAIGSRWRDWLARLAVTSRLSRLLGRQQAAYLRRMLKMFDDGDLDQALRHAIPLGSDGQSIGQAFGTPGPRNNLSLNDATGAASSIDFGADFETYLRQLYRKTFEKLDREGRVDEAVFVLAELLQARQEALDYLEKHQRQSQAAELALAWDWPPATIVRLLCLAGDWRRALAVARRDNAFASAVLQLQERWPDAANQLRDEWGQALALQGEWLKAVDAVWPAAPLREKAAAWLLAAEAAGGQLEARALVQRALLLPDTLQACLPRLQALRDDLSLHGERAALAGALNAATGHTDASRGLVAVLMPALLADQARGLGRLDKKALQALMRLNADSLLQADLPAADLPAADTQALSARPGVLTLEPPAVGAHDVLDAALLAEDRYLIAIGEAGLLVTDSAGRVRARFAVPAYRLVMAHSGQVALALAKRDGLWRVSRVDLVQRKVSDLGLCALDHFAVEFDGIAWTVARGRRIQVLDTTSSLQDVLWQVADLPGEVTELLVTRDAVQFVVDDEIQGPCLWRYQGPQRRLTSREPLAVPGNEMSRRLLHPDGTTLSLRGEPQDDGAFELRWLGLGGIRGSIRCFTTDAAGIQAWIDRDWLVLRLFDATCDVFFHQLRGGEAGASVGWPSGASVRARAVADGWLLFDDQGRVMHLDTRRSMAVGFAVR